MPEGEKSIVGAAQSRLRDMTDEVMDAILIACAQKVEHCEIASYGTVIAWAERLGFEINSVAAAGAEEGEDVEGEEQNLRAASNGSSKASKSAKGEGRRTSAR